MVVYLTLTTITTKRCVKVRTREHVERCPLHTSDIAKLFRVSHFYAYGLLFVPQRLVSFGMLYIRKIL